MLTKYSNLGHGLCQRVGIIFYPQVQWVFSLVPEPFNGYLAFVQIWRSSHVPGSFTVVIMEIFLHRPI